MHARSILIAVLLVCGSLYADEVVLESGARLSGLVEEKGDKVVVENMAGRIVLNRDQVVEIDLAHTAPYEVYLEKRDSLGTSDDPRAFLELAVWAKNADGGRFVRQHIRRAVELMRDAGDVESVSPLAAASAESLGEELRPLWERILAIDPSHEVARGRLGYHFREGRWLTEDEYQASLGNVQFEGRWMTPEERDFLIKERELKLDDRAKAIERQERELKQAMEDLKGNEKRLQDLMQDLDREKSDLDAREDRIRQKERFFARYRQCPQCNGYYLNNHICPLNWSFCGNCGGYFRPGHLCPP